MSFAHPYLLLLLLAIPIVAFALRRSRRLSVSPLPSTSPLASCPTTWRLAFNWIPSALRLLSLALIVVALARPQESSGWTTTSTEGIAIQIVLDRSGSMREPIGGDTGDTSKMEVAKKTVAAFVEGDGKKLKGRTGDMVGLIAFARYADTLAPLARGHEALIEADKRVKPAEIRAEDGTAIGDALALAAARLKRAEEDLAAQAKPGEKPEFSIKSKVIVLMTDGQNNAGDVSPYDAAAQAKEWGIRIYTIGVGAGERVVKMNTLFGPQEIPMGNDVDEQMLTRIAESTGGSYFSAGSPDALAGAYAAIDKLERSRIQATEHSAHTELFTPVAAAGLGLLALELLLGQTAFRRVV